MKQDVSSQINEICLISKPTVIEGVLNTKSDIRVDGTFKGNIRTTGKVVVGESALIDGKVVAQNADISGNIKGQLVIQDALYLRSKAVLNGNLLTSRLSIDIGAQFNGNCRIATKEDFDKALEQIFPTPTPTK